MYGIRPTLPHTASFKSKQLTKSNLNQQNFAGNKSKAGDTVSFSSNQQTIMVPDIYPPFQIALDIVKNNLIRAIDGMIPYGPDAPPDLQGFPQGNSYHYAPGFRADLSLNGEQTFNKAPVDGGIDYNERTLALNELEYCTSEMYPQGTPENNACLNAKNLLHSLFNSPLFGPLAGRIRPDFDVNNNGVFDAQDAEVLARLDGDPTSLSKTDLDIASNNYVNYQSNLKFNTNVPLNRA